MSGGRGGRTDGWRTAQKKRWVSSDASVQTLRRLPLCAVEHKPQGGGRADAKRSTGATTITHGSVTRCKV